MSPVGPAWLATKIVIAVNGKVIQTEEYSDWKAGRDLPVTRCSTSRRGAPRRTGPSRSKSL